MSNGTPKRRRDQPESDAGRSRDLDKLNRQIDAKKISSLRRPNWRVIRPGHWERAQISEMGIIGS